MSTLQEELFAAGIRRQIAYLEGILQELESEPGRNSLFLKRIRDVENQLRELRTHIREQ